MGYLPEGHRFPGYLTARQTLSIFDAASVGVIHVADLRSSPLAARLSAALAERGATKKSTPAGDYYLIPDRHADGSGHGSGPAGIAFASARLAMRRAKVHVSGDDAATAIVSSMKSVQLLALQATAKGDALKLAATGLVSDAETAGLMEDALRGVLAAWRLAAQEKSPDTVSVLRKFTVSRDKDTVSISGTLPGATVRALAEKKHAD